ncbi:MAG: tRNA (adenosine(37)-N6)-dimethylallyltransferase MiaA [Bdellovibrionales bacterium]|nr:tRNA (adenosine(37)-N6)-dimethylallyltransferase MiaA [Bdellovibrionales bacterium]
MVVSSNLITFVVGPTASGKSNWALSEAEKSGGAIVNADSVQAYTDLTIGAAKPSEEDRKRISHYLYDIISPHDNFTAGDYRRKALQIIEEKISAQPLFFVGGSGFYIQALEKGMFEIEAIPPHILQMVDEIKSQNRLFEELKLRDMKAAIKIGPTDPYRLERALGVVLSEGRALDIIRAEFESQNKPLGEQYKLKKIGIYVDRDQLRKRVVSRTKTMLASGFIEEVEGLLSKGFADTKALKSVGYKEVVSFLKGELKREELLSLVVTSTMQLAKRQMTWFKRDQEIQWISPNS